MPVNLIAFLKTARCLILLCLLTAPLFTYAQLPVSVKPLRSLIEPTPNKKVPVGQQSVLADHPGIRSSNAVAVADNIFPVEDCFTYTYKLTAGSESFVRETFTTRGGTTYIIGYTIVAGEYRGMLQQLNMTGDIAWTKTYVFPGTTLVLNNIKQLPNGNLVIIGTKDFLNNGVKMPVIFTADDEGNILLSRTLDMGGFEGMYVSPSSNADVGIGFVAQHQYTIVYGKMDINGWISWFRSIPALDNGKVVGMVHYDYSRWFIAFTGEEAGKRTGIITGINPDNGNTDWGLKFGGTASTQEFIFHDLEIVNLRPRISGIYSNAGGPYQLFKATINTVGVLETLQSFAFPGINFTTTARTSISSWGDVMTFSQSAIDNDIYVFKMITEAYPDNQIAWAKKFAAIGVHELINVERMFDGGYLIAANKSTSNQELFLKTDSLGMIKACAPSDFDASSITTSPVVPSVNLNCPNETSHMTNITLNSVNITLPSVHECKSLSCPPRPPEDPCLENFARRFRSPSHSDIGSSIVTDDDGKITIAGMNRNDPYNAGGTAFFAQMDNAGKLLNRKTITLGNSTSISKILRSKNGGFIALSGSSYAASAGGNEIGWMSVLKFDVNLQLMWTKSCPVPGPFSAQFDIVESNDGSIFVNYMEGNGFCNTMKILKLNADGSLNWLKQYQGPGLCILGHYASMTQDDNFLYCANPSGDEMLVFKIEKNSGNVVWTKGFRFPWISYNTIGLDISVMNDQIVFQGKDSDEGNARDIIIILDKNGTLIKIKSFSTPLSTGMGAMVVTRNDELVMVGTDHSTGTFYRLDKDLNILYTKQINLEGSAVSAVHEGAGGNIYELSNIFNPSAYLSDFSIKKYSFNGEIGTCVMDTLILGEETPIINQRNVTAAANNLTVALQSLPYLESNYPLQEHAVMCIKPATCNSLTMENIPDICNVDPFVVTANKNAGCNGLVSFEYDKIGLELIAQTPASVTLRAKESGNYTVKTKLFTGCLWLEDQKTFNATINTKALSLGSDTVLCSGSIQLNAGKGFANYLWNDGSVDSVLTVNQSGKYYVEVGTGCSGTLSDTLNVIVAVVPSLHLGADTSFCKGDSVVINAGNSFAQYLWSDGGTSPVIALKNSGRYSLIAFTTEHCKVFDTIEVINTWDVPVVDFNNKSYLCHDSSLNLYAGSHASYLWQDGSSLDNYSVTQPGQYHVIVSNIFGCKASDTASILGVLPLPSTFLPADDFVCPNGELQLSPLRNYNDYTWSTGENSRNIVIKSAGEYWLQVTDENGCIGRDSIRILPKECLKGIYMPTAFTPNNDGKNDILKPYTGGNIKYYQLNIFDRWGRLVFTTTDIKKGWNGEVKGIPQDTNGFAWTCVYQLEGGERKKETGMAMLVR